jgi:DNA polymerase-4
MCHRRDVEMDSTPVLEPISIDEALQDGRGLGHLIGPLETIGQRIKEAICTTVGLTVSAGIGSNRRVARIFWDVDTPPG